MSTKNLAFIAALALLLVASASARTQAQPFPSRTITLVVGFAPGSVQDAAARIVARGASPLLGVQIIVDNKPGAGTMPHLAAELFRARSGIKMTHVPYRGGAPALTDVIAGNVQLTFVTPVAKAQIYAGRVVALAVASDVRLETLPNIPTFAEAGLSLPELNAGAWFGILAPKGTPELIVHKLNAAFNAVLRNPQVRDGIKALGLVPKAMTPEQFGAFMRGDMRKWPPIIAAAGLSAE